MLTSLLFAAAALGQVAAQNVRPQIGYVYPSGGRAGTTIDVRLGTYDWTPDMQVFVHNPRIKIEITGPAGEPILTPPPYWFGQKAGQAQPPLPREVPARITIPADMPPGAIKWQAANANGGTNVNTFVVSDEAEFVEPETHDGPLDLPSLPVNVSGRISRVTEIDTYRFTAPAAGLVTCRLDGGLGQRFRGQLMIQDAVGKLITDKADTTGEGILAMFTAQAGAAYEISLHDVEFGGDRGYVYRLSIQTGPQIVVTLPLVLAAGKEQPVEFIGWGVATGAQKLESVTSSVKADGRKPRETMDHAFDTPAGRASATLHLGENADTVEPESAESAARQLTIPAAIAGSLHSAETAGCIPTDRYSFTAKKGDALRLSVEAARFGSPVDPSLAVVGSDGKELARNDDLLGTVDAAVDVKIPADGEYTIVVSDFSGVAPSRANVYRLVVENSAEAFDFTIEAPDRFDVPLGGKADLVVKSARRGTWDDSIELKFEGLPEGVALPVEPPPEPTPPPKPGAKPAPKPRAKKAAPGDIKTTLVAAETAPATAALVMVVGTATVGDRTIERRSGPVLVTTTLKTRCKVKSTVQDGGRIVNRGTTYPADLIIERLEGYAGPITLRMAATQQRQRRGIRADELIVPAGVERVQYPIFMPEWLETSLTARMIVIGVAQVPDAKGNVRHVTGIMDGFVVMSMEGALLKLSHEPQERVVKLGGQIDIPVRVARTVKLPEAVRVEVVADGLFSAEPITLSPSEASAVVRVRTQSEPRLIGARQVTIRATALQNGRWPVVSETAVPLVIESDGAVAAK